MDIFFFYRRWLALPLHSSSVPCLSPAFVLVACVLSGFLPPSKNMLVDGEEGTSLSSTCLNILTVFTQGYQVFVIISYNGNGSVRQNYTVCNCTSFKSRPRTIPVWPETITMTTLRSCMSYQVRRFIHPSLYLQLAFSMMPRFLC